MNPPVSALRGVWRRRVVDVLLAQLRQGITPHKIALSIALGTIVAIFPLMGTTTALCLLVGIALRLNQPMLQLVNWIAWPLQIPGIYFFVRAGEWITRTPPISFSIPALLVAFKNSPVRFLQQYGMTGLRGVLAWALMAPLLAALLYVLTLPLLQRMSRSLAALAGKG
jgi:uncharacterized protein (DUF2062 family)